LGVGRTLPGSGTNREYQGPACERDESNAIMLWPNWKCFPREVHCI
jgi:hypothetical protein